LTSIREVPPRLAPVEDLLWIEDLAMAQEVNAYPHGCSIGLIRLIGLIGLIGLSIKESGYGFRTSLR
jgi:hypothetical protein